MKKLIKKTDFSKMWAWFCVVCWRYSGATWAKKLALFFFFVESALEWAWQHRSTILSMSLEFVY